MNTTETWYYAGKRISGGKLYNAWLTDSGSLSLFKKLDGVIGAAHSVEVVRDGDKLTVRGPPKYVRQETHEKADEWRAIDTADRTAHAAKRREAKAKRDGRDIGSMTLDQIAATYGRLFGTQRAALMTQVILRLQRG